MWTAFINVENILSAARNAARTDAATSDRLGLVVLSEEIFRIYHLNHLIYDTGDNYPCQFMNP